MKKNVKIGSNGFSIERLVYSPAFGILLAVLGFSAIAQPARATPVTLTIDNPHQTILRPTKGQVVLDFFGTVSFGDEFHFEEAVLDTDYNQSSTSGIPTELGSLDFSQADLGGSVTGVLFTAVVTPLTTPGIYGFHFGGHRPAEFAIEGSNERRFVTAAETFSILVRVSDQGNTALLLSLSILFLAFLPRRYDRLPASV